MLGGVSLLTKMIIDQTLSAKGAIAASIQRRAAMTAELESQVRLTALEAQRTRQVAALALTEVNLARQEFNSATTRTTRAAATIRLTQAEIAHNLAVNQSTAALGANTVAQNALNASRTLGARALALVGGPIGAIVLGVTALAAGYMYMSGKVAEANQKLAEQAEVAKKAKEELMALRGLEKDDAINDMTESLTRQNQALSESSSTINMQLDAIGRLYKGNKDVVKVVQDAKDGTISMSDAVIRFNEIRINKEVYNSFKKNADIFSKNALEATNSQAKLKMFGIEVETAGKKAQISTNGINASTVELEKNAVAASNATSKLQSYYASLRDQNYSNSLTIGYLNEGYSVEQAQALSKVWSEAYESGEIVTKEREQQILKSVALEVQKNKLIDDRNKKEKDATKEIEKQQKALQVNAKVQANASKFGFENTEAKYGLPKGLLAGVHMQESRGNANAVGPMTKYGTAKGGFQFLDSTAERFKLIGNDVFNLGKSAEAAAKYFQFLYKKFGNWDEAISAYHAGEGNVAAGTNIGPVNRQYVANVKGYIAGANGYSGSSKEFDSIMDDQAKYAQKTLEEIDQLNTKYSSADINRNKDRLAEIAEAERLGQTKLIDQINLRYSDESYLAKLQLDQQVNGWKWVGEERINKETEVNRAVANASKEFSKDQKQLVMNGIDALAKYEIDEYRKTQQLKIAEYQLAFSQPLTELQAEVLDMQAKANMGDYGSWALQNQYGKDLNSLGAEYDKNANNINEDKTITDDATRKQLLLDAEESFRLSKLALNEKYTLLEQDLAHAQYESQMSQYSQMISIASDTWGRMTSVIKDAQGENSTAYKAMFLIQQTMAAAQAIIYGHVASSAAVAPPPIGLGIAAGMPLSGMLKANGYANAALIMAQGIAGMAHNGIDNIPKEGTWLLDKGERVVDSRTNGDLKQYLANRQSDGPKVTINNNASVDVSARQNSDGTLTIDVVERFIADSLSQPNSKIRKSLNRNTTATARR